MNMLPSLDALEQRVAASAELIANLRRKIAALEAGIAEPRRPAVPKSHAAGEEELARLAAENNRLRAERALIRERVHLLVREIERAGK